MLILSEPMNVIAFMGSFLVEKHSYKYRITKEVNYYGNDCR